MLFMQPVALLVSTLLWPHKHETLHSRLAMQDLPSDPNFSSRIPTPNPTIPTSTSCSGYNRDPFFPILILSFLPQLAFSYPVTASPCSRSQEPTSCWPYQPFSPRQAF